MLWTSWVYFEGVGEGTYETSYDNVEGRDTVNKIKTGYRRLA